MNFRIEKDSLGEVNVPSEKLWGAQTQRALDHFFIGHDCFPQEMVFAFAIIKKACAVVNLRLKMIEKAQSDLVLQVCDEILSGQWNDQFPLHLWVSGSGTQFNMNMNEVIANRACQIAGKSLGEKNFIHPNDHVNLSQSSNDTFPTAMYISTAIAVTHNLLPALEVLENSLSSKAEAWKSIIKVGRTHLQDATPLTLGQEFSGYATLIHHDRLRIQESLHDIYELPIGGTAVGTGINAPANFDQYVTHEISTLTSLPFKVASNKFALQGSHDALVQLSGSLKTLANSLFKIVCDIRLLSSGPRCGIGELNIPQNEPGSSIMPGKVNPTQCESISQVCLQVIANDVAVTLGGCGGFLEMNVYKPLIISNILHSIRLLSDGCRQFKTFLLDGVQPNLERIDFFLKRSLMLVTALSPKIGYDRAAQVAHLAFEQDISLKEAALKMGVISEADFDRLMDPKKMISCSLD